MHSACRIGERVGTRCREERWTDRGPAGLTCAGLQAHEVARALSGLDGAGGVRVIAFRGEYRELVPSRTHLVHALSIPCPHGSRFSESTSPAASTARSTSGRMRCSRFARGGYEWRRVDARHLRETIAFPGFRRFAVWNWRFRLDEMTRLLSRRRFAAAVRRLVPEIQVADLAPARSEVRAPAISSDGDLVDDFVIHSVGSAMHLLNAPSPDAPRRSRSAGRLRVAWSSTISRLTLVGMILSPAS
jgi:(S)-2-hydroxyglutarate dehydrogenase